MSNKDLLADEGVYSVGRVFQKELKWIFRDQPKADHGIDAHVEVCNDGTPSGQLVAVQIKSGESYFSESCDEGFIFRFGDWHHNYWLGHCLPVIIALYNPIDELIFWQEISNETVESTGKNWKITIPYENLLNHRSGIGISQASISNTGGYENIDQYEYFRDLGVVHAEKVIAPLMNCIRNTREEILVCAPYIDSDFLSVLNVLSYTAKVKLITRVGLQDHIESTIRYHDSRSDNFSIKRNPHVNARFVIIDNKFSFTSSTNFTRLAFDKKITNMELIFPTTDKKKVNQYVSSFKSIWEKSTA
ncbi:DUF4365 domain-containing protein [Vibrio parahaemolyticus]|uniref:DUF4365 domain-containing protein n=1 Tax=Vibrio parahaemolyticus TaxID=670 RepID=UPI001123D834|nr:DUF4365 domain-containing protein [Vibrio parahaemolyticus]MBM4857848.1 DUF4365 domain-containing protein [Vibrio parahaemolyticus]TOH42727.1 hypothetical protein CGI81_23675 [Vibrio parahaemolyticus]HAS6858933.1 DUF4365 domain-containing protein [Vibrio parahaemolyticus]